MHVGLIDVDGHNWPNLVLMKLSAAHKSRGDTVELLKPSDVLTYSLFNEYDKLYAACVFKENKPTADKLNNIGVDVGGTGFGFNRALKPEAEFTMPDYSLYGIADTAYGFMTRGCPRACPFCIVSTKEGRVSIKTADLGQFWSGQKNIKLLDPNILACNDSISLLAQLADSEANIDFTQGLDIRLMTRSKQQLINLCKIQSIHFAWDDPCCEETYQNLKRFRSGFPFDERKLSVYVLTNFNTTHAQDLDRVYKLRELCYTPYVMIYNKQNAPRHTRHLQRWVNNKRIFRTIDKFEDFDPRKG